MNHHAKAPAALSALQGLAMNEFQGSGLRASGRLTIRGLEGPKYGKSLEGTPKRGSPYLWKPKHVYLDALGFLSLEGRLNVREVAGTFVK